MGLGLVQSSGPFDLESNTRMLLDSRAVVQFVSGMDGEVRSYSPRLQALSCAEPYEITKYLRSNWKLQFLSCTELCQMSNSPAQPERFRRF